MFTDRSKADCSVWATTTQVLDPHLASLASRLPASTVYARQPATVLKYSRAFAKWKNWAEKYQEIPVIPVTSSSLALYLQFLIDENSSISTIDAAYFGLKWAHKIADLPCPTDSPIPKLVWESAHRQLKRNAVRRDPISSQTIQKIIERYGSSESLLELRFASMSTLLYTGMMRFDDLIRVRRSDLTFGPDYLKILIRSSKTDVCGEGQLVFISSTGNDRCPIDLLVHYLKVSHQWSPAESDLFLFRRILGSGPQAKLSNLNTPISYSQARTILKRFLLELGLDSSHLSLHSFRIGAATAANANGVNAVDIKNHGRWKSDTARNLYIRTPTNQKLSVSRNLGL